MLLYAQVQPVRGPAYVVTASTIYIYLYITELIWWRDRTSLRIETNAMRGLKKLLAQQLKNNIYQQPW